MNIKVEIISLSKSSSARYMSGRAVKKSIVFVPAENALDVGLQFVC